MARLVGLGHGQRPAEPLQRTRARTVPRPRVFGRAGAPLTHARTRAHAAPRVQGSRALSRQKGGPFSHLLLL